MKKGKSSTSLVLAVLVLSLSAIPILASAQLVPDFSIAASPDTVIVAAGLGGSSTIILKSLNGFAGSVNLTLPPLCLSLFCPTWSISPTKVVLGAGGTASATLLFSAPLTGNYIVRVTGTSGSISHYVDVYFTVIAAGDFAITATPTSMAIARGSSGTTSITLTSPGTFAGSVTLTANISPFKQNGPSISLSPTTVTVASGGTASSTLTVYTFKNTSPKLYSIDVIATNGSISHSITISVSVTS